MQLLLTFASCCLVPIIKDSVLSIIVYHKIIWSHPTPNITDAVSHWLAGNISIRRSISAEWYIQMCIIRVAVDLWEVAFNYLKQFARVDTEKQPGGTPCFKGNWPETSSSKLLTVVVITIRRIFLYVFFPLAYAFHFLIEQSKYRSLKYYLWIFISIAILVISENSSPI